MRLVMILTAFFICTGCNSGGTKTPDPNPVKVEPVKKMGENSSKGNLIVKARSDNKLFIGNKELPLPELDSLLAIGIDSLQQYYRDTISVVIDADSATDYGIVYRIMKAAKKQHVRVVVEVAD